MVGNGKLRKLITVAKSDHFDRSGDSNKERGFAFQSIYSISHIRLSSMLIIGHVSLLMNSNSRVHHCLNHHQLLIPDQSESKIVPYRSGFSCTYRVRDKMPEIIGFAKRMDLKVTLQEA